MDPAATVAVDGVTVTLSPVTAPESPITEIASAFSSRMKASYLSLPSQVVTAQAFYPALLGLSPHNGMLIHPQVSVHFHPRHIAGRVSDTLGSIIFCFQFQLLRVTVSQAVKLALTSVFPATNYRTALEYCFSIHNPCETEHDMRNKELHRLTHQSVCFHLRDTERGDAFPSFHPTVRRPSTCHRISQTLLYAIVCKFPCIGPPQYHGA